MMSVHRKGSFQIKYCIVNATGKQTFCVPLHVPPLMWEMAVELFVYEFIEYLFLFQFSVCQQLCCHLGSWILQSDVTSCTSWFRSEPFGQQTKAIPNFLAGLSSQWCSCLSESFPFACPSWTFSVRPPLASHIGGKDLPMKGLVFQFWVEAWELFPELSFGKTGLVTRLQHCQKWDLVIKESTVEVAEKMKTSGHFQCNAITWNRVHPLHTPVNPVHV